jgi:hypothetical protein
MPLKHASSRSGLTWSEYQTVAANLVRKYLLGQTSEAERLTIEERLMANDDTYEELLIVEDELTDEYLRGQLSQSERKDFETYFLVTPSRQEKLRLAKVIRGHLATHSPSKNLTPDSHKFSLFGFFPLRNSVLSYSVGIAAVLLLVSLSWVLLRSFTSSRGPRPRVTLTLTPGLTRNGSVENSVSIPPNVEVVVRVQLVLTEDGSYQSYTAVFEAIDGRTVARERVVSSEVVNHRRVVVVELSSKLLPAGEYRAKLNGVSAAGEVINLGSYNFNVLAP